MKKIVATCILSFALLTSSLPGQISYAEPINSVGSEVYSSFIVKNMSDDNIVAEQQTLSVANSLNTSFLIESIGVIGSNVNVEAVMNDNKISLGGELKRTYASPDKIIVGDLKDKDGKYDVVHFSINRSSLEFVPASGVKHNGDSINIYLQEHGTRNFKFVEVKVPEKLELNDLFSKVDSFNKFNNEELMWFQKVVKPTSISESHSDPEVFTTKAAIGEQRSQSQYVIDFTWGGAEQADFVWVNHILTYPLNTTDRQVTATIQKYTSYAWDYTNKKKVSDDTATNIVKPTVMIGLTNGKFQDMSVSGLYNKGNASIKASINFGYSAKIPVPGVGLNFSFDNITKVTVYPVNVFKNPSIYAEVTDGKYLGNNGDHMYTTANINENSKGTVYARFKYTVDNPFSTKYGDT